MRMFTGKGGRMTDGRGGSGESANGRRTGWNVSHQKREVDFHEVVVSGMWELQQQGTVRGRISISNKSYLIGIKFFHKMYTTTGNNNNCGRGRGAGIVPEYEGGNCGEWA